MQYLRSVVVNHPGDVSGVASRGGLRWGGSGHCAHSDAQVAARLSRVDVIAERLPRGWDSRVGEGGGSLSGGERQRASIARALLKPAPLLLVDEATSALDTENERAVATAVAVDPVPRTRVIVAHRVGAREAGRGRPVRGAAAASAARSAARGETAYRRSPRVFARRREREKERA